MKRFFHWAFACLFIGLSGVANAQTDASQDLYARLEGTMRLGSAMGTPADMALEYFISGNRLRVNLQTTEPTTRADVRLAMVMEMLPDSSFIMVMQIGEMNPIRITIDRDLMRDLESGMFGHEARDSLTNDYRTIDNVRCRKMIRISSEQQQGRTVTQRTEMWYPADNAVVISSAFGSATAAVLGPMAVAGLPLEFSGRREEEGQGTIYLNARLVKQKRKRLPASTWRIESRLRTVELSSEQFREQLSRDAGMQDL